MAISIVLFEPETPGNIGAIARAMKNFNLENLILINPKCKIDEDASKRAMHAKDILTNAKIKPASCLKEFHTVIGTTSKLGTDYNIPRSPITPEQLTKVITEKKETAIVFGREDKGLSNKELEFCDFVVTIPTSKKYPEMNLSHSAAIIFYELFKNKENISSHIVPASKKDKEYTLKMINSAIDKVKFATPSKKRTQQIIWKRIIGKSFITRREAFALMGFFKKLK